MKHTHYTTVTRYGDDSYSQESFSNGTDERVFLAQVDGEGLVDYNFCEFAIKVLTGKVLTVIDASVPEGPQQKAIKDLLRGCFSETFEEFAKVTINTRKLLGDSRS